MSRPVSISLCTALLVLVGCHRAGESGPTASATHGAASNRQHAFDIAPGGVAVAKSGSVARHGQDAIASWPDAGDLVHYWHGVDRVRGAYTWFRSDVSEAHALKSIATGRLRFTTPDGEILDLAYDHHVEHPSGDWTWVGHLSGDASAQTIVTFGQDAVYGTIAQIGKPALRITMKQGLTWLVRTDPAKVPTRALSRPDFLIADRASLPRPALNAGTSVGAATTASAIAQSASADSAEVDLLVGYTPGFVEATGGASAVMTRLNYLVDVSNAAYANSKINAHVRLVQAMQVNYTDNNSNDAALQQMSGYDSTSQSETTPDAAFNGLRAARDTYGADVVALVRDFRTPENDGCGIAWLLGGGLQGIHAGEGWDTLAYSVVSDGQDIDEGDGKTYYCLDETLVHELGHNMGAAHDKETAKGDDGVLDNPDDYGAYPYSFGYKSAATTGNFYTIMAYGDAGQGIFRAFSSPTNSFCGGRACGTSDTDNTRTLLQTIPVVATFRQHGRLSPDAFVPRDLLAIQRNGDSGTEVSFASRTSNYKSGQVGAETGLRQSGIDGSWAFQLGNFNGDGIRDLYAIKKIGASGRTEVHVLNGADGYQTFLMHRATVLGSTGGDHRWVFRLGDYNRDGRLDLYAIDRMGNSGTTEMHVLNGADNFGSYLTHRASVLPASGRGNGWKFDLADFNHDGFLDVYAISKQAASGKTEVNVLDGASGFKAFLFRGRSVLPNSGSDNTWDFKVADYNGDDAPDVYAILKQGASGRTELHVMDGSMGFASYLIHIATVLPTTGRDNAWEFDLAD